MTRKERLEKLEKELIRQQEWYKVCQANNSTINYSPEDYARESMLKRKIQETKEWIQEETAMKELKYYGGNGYDSATEEGLYVVRANGHTEFTKLSEARKYYDSLNESKALWDLTATPELLERHKRPYKLDLYQKRKD